MSRCALGFSVDLVLVFFSRGRFSPAGHEKASNRIRVISKPFMIRSNIDIPKPLKALSDRKVGALLSKMSGYPHPRNDTTES